MDAEIELQGTLVIEGGKGFIKIPHHRKYSQRLILFREAPGIKPVRRKIAYFDDEEGGFWIKISRSAKTPIDWSIFLVE